MEIINEQYHIESKTKRQNYFKNYNNKKYMKKYNLTLEQLKEIKFLRSEVNFYRSIPITEMSLISVFNFINFLEKLNSYKIIMNKKVSQKEINWIKKHYETRILLLKNAKA